MNRWIVLGAGLALAAAVHANDFFGIPILENPSDDLSGILYSLAEGNREKAEELHKHLVEVAPKLAKEVSLKDFELPCANCAVEKDAACSFCHGTDWMIDPVSLHYLLWKFEQVFELEPDSDELLTEIKRANKKKQVIQSSILLADNIKKSVKAWGIAKEQFLLRKQLVLKREIFQGAVLEIDPAGLLILLAEDEGTIYLAGCNTSESRVGEFLVGYMWPMEGRSYSYTDAKGEKKTVKQYNANLWREY